MFEIHNSYPKIHSSYRGFSLVEIVLAIAIFMILAVVGVTTILQSFSVSKLSEEQIKADFYAQEGIEAVRSIKNRGWGGLTPGSYGLQSDSGNWVLSGVSDTKDKYTRQIEISEVERNINGDIMESGGTVDADTLKITSNVNWNFSGTRDDTVSYFTYMTNFQKTKEGILIYGDGTNIPKWRNYSNISNSFDREAGMAESLSGLNFVVRTSPLQREAVAGIVNGSGELQVFCYGENGWDWQWTQSVGGNASTRRFDISYETNSGDVLVVFNDNDSNRLGYRTKSGSNGCGGANWSNALIYSPLRTNGVIHWIKMAWDKRSSSDLITVIWADANSDLSTAVWSGTAFSNEPSAVTESSLEVVSTALDVDCFDIEYESVSGGIMLVWANSAGNNGTNGVRYRTCAGGTASCTWGAVETPPMFSDDAHNLDISGNPLSNEIVFASVGYAGCDMQVGYWNGSSWSNSANIDTSVVRPNIGTRLVATGWLNNGSYARSVVVYHDATNNACNFTNGDRDVDWYVGNSGSFSKQTDFSPSPLFANPQKWYQIYTDPINSDRFMLVVSDSANDLFEKRLVMTSALAFSWTNSDGGTALETDLGWSTSVPFGFGYWRNP